MSSEKRPDDPARQQSALAELEKLQRAIEQSRERRVRANQAFDSFIREFDGTGTGSAAAERRVAAAANPLPLPAPVAPAAPLTVNAAALDEFPTETGPRPPAASAPLDVSSRAPEPEPAVPVHADRAVPAALAAPAPVPPPFRARRIGVLAAAAAVLAGLAVVFLVFRPDTPDTAAEAGAPAAAPSSAAVASPEPAPTTVPTPSPAPPPPPAELITLRPVWVRVMVDGRKMIEREMEANARVPLAPTGQLMIRAGDAGAVRVAIGGADQGPLGRDGVVVTRTFTLPPPPPR